LRPLTTVSHAGAALPSGAIDESCQNETPGKGAQKALRRQGGANSRNSHEETASSSFSRGAMLFFMLLLIIGGLFAGGYFERLRVWLEGPTETYLRNAGITLDKILIKGQRHLNDQRIIKALGIRTGQSLFGFDARKAQERLAALGMVREARVMRMLPSTLLVEIRERVPFARWLHDGEIELIDRDGVVLSGVSEDEGDRYPLVAGKGAAVRARRLLRILSVHQEVAKELKMAQLVSGRRWNLYARNGALIKLSADNLAMGLARFVRLPEWRALLRQPGLVVDLRVPDRAYLLRSGG